MKISIDTKHDSYDDIMKAIELLTALVNNPTQSVVNPEPSQGAFNMFGDQPSEEPKNETAINL